MTHEDYCSYELSKKLKAAGFDWECSHYYTKGNSDDDKPWIIGDSIEVDWNENGIKATPFIIPLCSAPTLAVAAKWLREVIGYHIQVRICGLRDMYSVEILETKTNGLFLKLKHSDDYVIFFDSYEKALTAGLTFALNLLKDN